MTTPLERARSQAHHGTSIVQTPAYAAFRDRHAALFANAALGLLAGMSQQLQEEGHPLMQAEAMCSQLDHAIDRLDEGRPEPCCIASCLGYWLYEAVLTQLRLVASLASCESQITDPPA